MSIAQAGALPTDGPLRRHPDSPPRRSFDLRDGPLFDQLDEEELSVADRMYSTAH